MAPSFYMKNVELNSLPFHWRILLTSFLLTVGVGYVAALFYLFLVDVDPHNKMGMGAAEGIAMKYHGVASSSRLEAALNGSMSDRLSVDDKDALIKWVQRGASAAEFDRIKPILDKNCVMCHGAQSGVPLLPLTSLADVRKVSAVDTGASVSTLARLSHVHLFGLSLIFVLTGGIYALCQAPSYLRVLFIVLPYLAIWMDVGAWWVTKYFPAFSYVVLAGGAIMGLSLAVQLFSPLWEMWLKGRVW